MSKTILRAVDENYFNHPLIIAKERVENYRRMKKSQEVETLIAPKRIPTKVFFISIAVMIICFYLICRILFS